MTDVDNSKILTTVEKFLISPHDRYKKLKFTLFCCKISWFAVCDLRAFCVEKICSQKCAMWRQNDKYDVWSSVYSLYKANTNGLVRSLNGLVGSPNGLEGSQNGLAVSPNGLVGSLNGLVRSLKGVVGFPHGLVWSQNYLVGPQGLVGSPNGQIIW